MSLAVANQYAKALLDVVGKPGSAVAAEAALEQIAAFTDVIKSSPELRSALLSPAITPKQKANVVARIAKTIGVAALISNFISVVVSHRRIAALPAIVAAYRAQLDEKVGLIRADITTARPLAPEQKAGLESKLTALTAGAVRCSYAENAALLGGVTVQLGSKVLDGSVRGQLNALKRRLAVEA